MFGAGEKIITFLEAVPHILQIHKGNLSHKEDLSFSDTHFGGLEGHTA